LADSPRRRLFCLALAAVALAALPACGVRGLSFKADDRVDIIRPRDRDEVRLPLTVEWTVHDFAVGAGKGSFGVLLDQAPPRPGKTLAWLFRGDRSCKGASGKALCQTPEFLERRKAYQTTDTSFTIDLVPRLSGNDRRRQFHEFTVVLLDRAGARIGEGAWSVQFQVPRQR
jgi:hypothetical protein